MYKIRIFLMLSLMTFLSLMAYGQDWLEEARRYRQRGERYSQQGKYEEAEVEFKKALSILSRAGPEAAAVEKEVQDRYQKADSVSEEEKKELPPEKLEMIVEEKPTPVRAARTPEYIIGEGDVLYITVWQEDLNQEVIVRPDGMVSFPLAGDIPAVGLTIPQLDAEITKRLQEYIRYPEVSISVRKIAGQKIIVLGEVDFPGVYTVSSNSSVLEAIALAGGFTQDAVLSSVILIRGGFTEPEGRRLNLNQAIIKPDKSQNIPLYPSDIIYVPKKFIANVNYFVNQIIGPISQGSQSIYATEKLRDARW